ncbi:DUF4389 domain-containing protein [Nocardia acidivorans]|uniref:DUF4389 domain-containing protein n=1 Tax=Nocardia acidivorans TaxID=404580 RepID=UPI000A649DD5|nr:DUF4389 domain-containing protein [Nocardia acidivorans]
MTMGEPWPTGGQDWQPTGMQGGGEALVELDVFPPQEHRRWTVLLRLLLVIPQLIVMWFLGIAAFVVVVCGWFGALFTGRLPVWCGDFLRGYFSYSTRVYGYAMLLVDEYPPFAWNPPNYPVRVLFPQPTELNRLAVLFRLILAFPILVFSSWLTTGWAVLSFFIWLIVLITGRMPRSVFEATTAIMRTELRTQAYTYLLTPAYLKGVFGDQTGVPADPAAEQWGQPPRQSPTRPLLLSRGGQILLIVMLILGIIASVLQTATGNDDDDSDDFSMPTSQTVTR